MPILSVNSDKGLLREPSEFHYMQASDKGLRRGPSGAFLLGDSFGKIKRDLQLTCKSLF